MYECTQRCDCLIFQLFDCSFKYFLTLSSIWFWERSDVYLISGTLILLSILSCIRSFTILTEFSFDHISSILSFLVLFCSNLRFPYCRHFFAHFLLFHVHKIAPVDIGAAYHFPYDFPALNFTALTIPSFSFEESLYNSYLPKAFITFFGFYKNSYMLVIIFVSCDCLMSFSKSLKVFISPSFLFVFFALLSAFWSLLLILVINIGCIFLWNIMHWPYINDMGVHRSWRSSVVCFSVLSPQPEALLPTHSIVVELF